MQKRNSAKGRIKGLRNNIRKFLDEKDVDTFLTYTERATLRECEIKFDKLLINWKKSTEEL